MMHDRWECSFLHHIFFFHWKSYWSHDSLFGLHTEQTCFLACGEQSLQQNSTTSCCFITQIWILHLGWCDCNTVSLNCAALRGHVLGVLGGFHLCLSWFPPTVHVNANQVGWRLRIARRYEMWVWVNACLLALWWMSTVFPSSCWSPQWKTWVKQYVNH